MLSPVSSQILNFSPFPIVSKRCTFLDGFAFPTIAALNGSLKIGNTEPSHPPSTSSPTSVFRMSAIARGQCTASLGWTNNLQGPCNGDLGFFAPPTTRKAISSDRAPAFQDSF